MAIHELSALQLSASIHRRELSCREVMQAFLQRIAAINPQANAIVNLQDADILMQQADACDAELTTGDSRGWLHGMPLAFKDLVDVAGIPTTCGSVLLRDNIPAHDALLVQRMKAAGGIVIGRRLGFHGQLAQPGGLEQCVRHAAFARPCACMSGERCLGQPARH